MIFKPQSALHDLDRYDDEYVPSSDNIFTDLIDFIENLLLGYLPEWLTTIIMFPIAILLGAMLFCVIATIGMTIYFWVTEKRFLWTDDKGVWFWNWDDKD